MDNKNVPEIESVIAYIEDHLEEKLDLEKVSQAAHYSKYHLHRMFTETLGMTIHDYVQRRQLSEAAKLLIFSDKPIIEISLLCGYESQQAFSAAFKAMYKISPAQFRENRTFYPLQLRFTLQNIGEKHTFTESDICLAETADIPAWMELMRLVIDGYPVMNETDYLQEIRRAILERRALVLKDGEKLIGALAYSNLSGCIDFLGIHPQYRRYGIQRVFLNTLMKTYLPGREICMTTYREGDKADTGHRKILKELGFAERELLIEFGYPTQRFVYPVKKEGDHSE